MDSFYIVCYYMKWVTTSWTHSGMISPCGEQICWRAKRQLRLWHPDIHLTVLLLALRGSCDPSFNFYIVNLPTLPCNNLRNRNDHGSLITRLNDYLRGDIMYYVLPEFVFLNPKFHLLTTSTHVKGSEWFF